MARKKAAKRADERFKTQITVDDTKYGGEKWVKYGYGRKSKADALRQLKAWEEQHKVEMEMKARGLYQEIEAMKTISFGDAALKWLEVKRNEAKENAYNLTYKNVVENHLMPVFKDKPLASIVEGDVRAFLSAQGKSKSYSLVNKMALCLKGIFRMYRHVCPVNPCKGVKSAKKRL